MRDELMSEIIKLEWDMFSHVSNVGGPASCQMRPDTFKIMRKSQAATWSDELLASRHAGRQKHHDREIRPDDGIHFPRRIPEAGGIPSARRQGNPAEDRRNRRDQRGMESRAVRPLSPSERQGPPAAHQRRLHRGNLL